MPRITMREGLALAGFLALSYSAAFVGNLGMRDWENWYAALAKPEWTPPGEVIGAVWTVLYALIGIAAWLVWRRAGFKGAPTAWALFGTQLALNAAWTLIFFGWQRPDLALLEILVLLAFIVATLIAFWRVTPAAGALLVPYAAWVAFATYLNAEIWRLNAA
jgi:translocator protein